MLTALLIIGILLSVILILFLALLCFPAALQIKLQNTNLSLRLRILGIPIRLYPQKTQTIKLKKAKPASKDATVDRPSFWSSLMTKDPQTILSQIKALLFEITRFTGCCKATLHQLTVVPFRSQDAASAALYHTAVSGGIAAILELLDQNTRLVIASPKSIDIRPNFTDENASVTLDLTLKFPPYRALLSLAQLTERLQNI